MSGGINQMSRRSVDLEVFPNVVIPGIKELGEPMIYMVIDKPLTSDEAAEFDNQLNHGREISGYNIQNFDTYLISALLDGAPPAFVYEVAQRIIQDKSKKSWQIAKEYGLNRTNYNELDLMNYTPRGRLKQYEGRLGLAVADFNFDPHAPMTEDMLPAVIEYLGHDLNATEALRTAIDGDVAVRGALEELFDLKGLKQKTAQGCAAEVIVTEYLRGNHDVELRDIKDAAARFRNCEFEYYVLPWVREAIKGTKAEVIADQIDGSVFRVIDGKRGNPDREWPKVITLDEDDNLQSGFGLGGIHTKDESWNFNGAGLDVASMYPAIVMNEGCAPRHMDEAEFHRIYGGLINRRMAAKKAKDKVTANAMKLILNSTFGGMNFPFSPLYSPCEFLHITISGQLSLIALMDRLANKKGASL